MFIWKTTVSVELVDVAVTGQLADWTSRGLVNSRTSQLAYL